VAVARRAHRDTYRAVVLSSLARDTSRRDRMLPVLRAEHSRNSGAHDSCRFRANGPQFVARAVPF